MAKEKVVDARARSKVKKFKVGGRVILDALIKRLATEEQIESYQKGELENSEIQEIFNDPNIWK